MVSRPSKAVCLISFGTSIARTSSIICTSFSSLNRKVFRGLRSGFHCHVRFSNRPFGVKHFQAIRLCGVGVAHGLVLLFGIGTKALPVWDSRTRRNNLWGGLAVVPRGTSFHRSVELECSPVAFNPNGPHAAVTSRVHRNSVPSTQMRCMITANRRASAAIAFFIPRCLAIFMAQALSQDHFAKRTSMI